LQQLAKVEDIDPADRLVQAEKYFLTGDETAKNKLIELMGAQSGSTIEVSIFYSTLTRWKEAAAILKMVEPPHNQDPWGTPPIYYYTLAYALNQAGDAQSAAEYRKKTQAAPFNPNSLRAVYFSLSIINNQPFLRGYVELGDGQIAII
jgi:hypothetical protein